MAEEKRVKLKDPVPTFDKFKYECARCGALLFETDNYCPWCGENVSGLAFVANILCDEKGE